jgi:hypothetical protein
MRRLLPALSLLFLLGSAALTGCDNHDICNPGEPCECSGGHECYVGCEGDGCNARCFQMEHCGAVCENDCSSQCFDVQECSTSCGDDCDVSCHNAVACGAICGDRCHFDCHDMDRCGVRAGNGSEINVHNYSRSEIECTGTCHVTSASPSACDEPHGCSVKCLGKAALTTCGDGSVACGACPAP